MANLRRQLDCQKTVNVDQTTPPVFCNQLPTHFWHFERFYFYKKNGKSVLFAQFEKKIKKGGLKTAFFIFRDEPGYLIQGRSLCLCTLSDPLISFVCDEHAPIVLTVL